MSYDVTFHCISEKELKRYVFDVLKNPGLASSRVKEVTSDSDKQENLLQLYNEYMCPWYQNESAGGEAIDASNFESYFPFCIAAIAGYLHPYWYARNGALSLMTGIIPDAGNLFTSFSKLDNSPLKKFGADSATAFISNYSCSGIIKDVDLIYKWLKSNEEAISAHLQGNELDSLYRALNYCIENNLWLMEATDLVVPMTNECNSNYDNLRAHFLKNVDIPVSNRPKSTSLIQRLFQKIL